MSGYNFTMNSPIETGSQHVQLQQHPSILSPALLQVQQQQLQQQQPVPAHLISQQPVPTHLISQQPVPAHLISQQPVPPHLISQQPVPGLLPQQYDGQMLAPASEIPPHSMPSPTSGPWNIDTMPWPLASTAPQPGGVMQFNAPTEPRLFNSLHQKRKSEMNVSIPPKQFISEEKITAHFNGLHISSDYIQTTTTTPITTNPMENPTSSATTTTTTTTGKCFTNLTYEDYQITAKELEEKLMNANGITICGEIKKFTDEQRKVSYLPEVLMNRIAGPCTALVLWQPPPVLDILKRTHEFVGGELKPSACSDPAMEDSSDGYDGQRQTFRAAPGGRARGQNDIDDYIDNNNTCNLDFNNMKPDSMDEDL